MSSNVTSIASAANMVAYSIPITPAPTTASERGQARELQNVVAREHALVVDGDAGRNPGRRAGGDDDERPVQLLRAVRPVDDDVVRPLEARRARHQHDVIALELRAHDLALAPHDHVRAHEQFLGGDLPDVERVAVEGGAGAGRPGR